MTRFRGMISTQPGSTPLASFKIVSLEEDLPCLTSSHGNDIGPYGDQDDEQVDYNDVVHNIDDNKFSFRCLCRRLYLRRMFSL